MKDKLEIERSVLEEVERRSHLPKPQLQNVFPDGGGAQQAKVAFLFLTMSKLGWPDVWEEFFRLAPAGLFSIYVHQAEASDGSQPLPLNHWGATRVQWVKTAWCALFGVEVASLAAALEDPNNVQFVFVSDSSVPLKRFDYVYHQLVRHSPTTSKFCLASQARFPQSNWEMFSQEMAHSCMFRDYIRALDRRTLKHHQWAVLARKHAATVVKRSKAALDVWAASWREAAPDMRGVGEGCSDEGVPITALLLDLEAQGASTGNTWADLTRLGVEESCLTYVRWRNCFTGTELDLSDRWHDTKVVVKEFGAVTDLIKNRLFGNEAYNLLQSPLKRELNGFPHAFDSVSEEYLRTLVKQNFMFARKMNAGMNVTMSDGSTRPLADVLPRMWDDVDWEESGSLTWRLAESSGKPSALGRPCGHA